MQRRFIELYNQELAFLRELGTEFAANHPRIAGRLGIEADECSDPYVERLLEGVAFLTARVQMKLNARFPELTQQLLESVYPAWLAPVPACGIVQLEPDRDEGGLQAGIRVPRGTALRTVPGKGELTACEFRTAHETTLWPVEIAEARYIGGGGALGALGLPVPESVRAGIRLKLQTSGELPFSKVPLNALDIHLKADPAISSRLYEALTARTVALVVRDTASGAFHRLDGGAISPLGFDDTEAMLPVPASGFGGYRLLAEYFALPERFHFIRASGLAGALQHIRASSCELYVLLDRMEPLFENALDATQFRLHCTPVANLFSKVIDRVKTSATEVEHHLVPDRNRPLDFEIAMIESVASFGAGGTRLSEVPPLSRIGANDSSETQQYYAVSRQPRLMSTAAERSGGRTSYLGTECFISLSGNGRAPVEQLEVRALCTNRDLPILARFGGGVTDFVTDSGAPIRAMRCIAGLTAPRLSPALADSAWRLVNHLAVNILSLSGAESQEGTALLRRFLRLHANPDDAVMARQIDGVRSIVHEPRVSRIPAGGPISFGRGLGIRLEVDESGFAGGSAMVLGAVLERFFARYVSINSFTQLRLDSVQRGLLREWTPRSGARALL